MSRRDMSRVTVVTSPPKGKGPQRFAIHCKDHGFLPENAEDKASFSRSEELASAVANQHWDMYHASKNWLVIHQSDDGYHTDTATQVVLGAVTAEEALRESRFEADYSSSTVLCYVLADTQVWEFAAKPIPSPNYEWVRVGSKS